MQMIAHRIIAAFAWLEDSLWGDAIGALAIFALLIAGLFITYGMF